MASGRSCTTYEEKLEHAIKEEFVVLVNPTRFIIVLPKYIRISETDMDRIRLMYTRYGRETAATELFDVLVKTENWFERTVEVLNDPFLQSGHVARAMLKQRAHVDEEMARSDPTQSEAISKQIEELDDKIRTVMNRLPRIETLGEMIGAVQGDFKNLFSGFENSQRKMLDFKTQFSCEQKELEKHIADLKAAIRDRHQETIKNMSELKTQSSETQEKLAEEVNYFKSQMNGKHEQLASHIHEIAAQFLIQQSKMNKEFADFKEESCYQQNEFTKNLYKIENRMCVAIESIAKTNSLVTSMSQAISEIKSQIQAPLTLATVCGKLEQVQKDVDSNKSKLNKHMDTIDSVRKSISSVRTDVEVVDVRAAATQEDFRQHKESTERHVRKAGEKLRTLEEMDSRIGHIDSKVQSVQNIVKGLGRVTEDIQNKVASLEQQTGDHEEDPHDAIRAGKSLETTCPETENRLKDMFINVDGKRVCIKDLLWNKITELESKMDNRAMYFSSLMHIPDRPQSFSFLTKAKTSDWYNRTGCIVIPRDGHYWIGVEACQAGDGAFDIGIQKFRQGRASNSWCAVTMTTRDQASSTAANVWHCRKGDMYGVAMGTIEGEAKPMYCRLTAVGLD